MTENTLENIPSLPDGQAANEVERAMDSDLVMRPPYQEHEWILSPQGKWYYYGEPTIRYYQSGARYKEREGDVPGHLIAAPKGALITKDTTAAMQELALDSKRTAALEGMQTALDIKRKVIGDIPNDYRKALGYFTMKAAMQERAPNQVAALRLGHELADTLPKPTRVSATDAAGNKLVANSVGELLEFIELVRGAGAAVPVGALLPSSEDQDQDAPDDGDAMPGAPEERGQDVD